jgi:hypothetical protein
MKKEKKKIPIPQKKKTKSKEALAPQQTQHITFSSDTHNKEDCFDEFDKVLVMMNSIDEEGLMNNFTDDFDDSYDATTNNNSIIITSDATVTDDELSNFVLIF